MSSASPSQAHPPARRATLSGLPPLAGGLLVVALALTALSGAYAGWSIAKVQAGDRASLERRIADLERELALRRADAAPAEAPPER